MDVRCVALDGGAFMLHGQLLFGRDELSDGRKRGTVPWTRDATAMGQRLNVYQARGSVAGRLAVPVLVAALGAVAPYGLSITLVHYYKRQFQPKQSFDPYFIEVKSFKAHTRYAHAG
jgi:hypothetical protein